MPNRLLGIRTPFLMAIVTVLVAIAAYIIGMAVFQARGSSRYSASDLYVLRAYDVLVVIWCFWVGSSIGSFLNVVAWRLPRGENINGRSHCPRCRAQLKARDNFPVFGWLALGGRCRTCRLPISMRYPIVEALVGLTVTLVSVAELYRFSLPRQPVYWHGGPFWTPFIDRQLIVTLLYHVIGLSLCWAVGLIRLDNHRLPGRLIGFALAVTIVPMLVYPVLMVVPWQLQVDLSWDPSGLYVDAWVRVITALAAATLLARYLAKGFCPAADPKLDPLGKSTARLIDLITILCIPIILVGWQASPAITVAAAVIAMLLARWLPTSSDALGRFAIAMPFALTMQLVFWRRLHPVKGFYSDDDSRWFWFWPSDGSAPWLILSWFAAVMLIPLWLRDVAPAEGVIADNSREPATGTEGAVGHELDRGNLVEHDDTQGDDSASDDSLGDDADHQAAEQDEVADSGTGSPQREDPTSDVPPSAT